MIGGATVDRKRRTVVAGSVLLVHVLLLWVAMLARMERSADEIAVPVFVSTTFDLPRAQGEMPANPDPPLRVQLRQFASRIEDVPVEPTPIEPPESELPDTAAVSSALPPASAAEPAEADAGEKADAGNASGQSGEGNGLVLLQRVPPVYPLAAARRGERGTTQVIMHITPGGRVDQVKVEQGSGSRLLDDAAVEAFRKWRFQQLPDSSKGGRWLRTTQRFVLYQFLFSRLDAGALTYVYDENLKPKSGTADEETPGSREALLRFIAQVRDQSIDAAGGASAVELAGLRASLEKWGAIRSVAFMGVVGSARWSRLGVKAVPAGGPAGGDVEVSWNTFEVRHQNATSEWLIARDRDGQVWAARAGQTS